MTRWAKAGSDFDLAVSLGWCDDSRALAFLSLRRSIAVLPGPSSKYRGKIAAALRLNGNARAAALGKLDLDIMRNVAPVAVTNIYNNLYFFSNRVDPRSLSFHRVYEDWSIPCARAQVDAADLALTRDAGRRRLADGRGPARRRGA